MPPVILKKVFMNKLEEIRACKMIGKDVLIATDRGLYLVEIKKKKRIRRLKRDNRK